jgi:hypothetical protein
MLELKLHRRRWLQVGSLGATGLALPQLLQAEEHQSAKPRARSCIFFFMCGGASQLDTFDVRPQASDEIRGPLGVIPSTVVGSPVCEHLPKLAGQLHRFTQIRSISHKETIHPQAVYQMLTGYEQTSSLAKRGSERVDMPHLGSAFAQADRLPAALPKFIRVPEESRIGGGSNLQTMRGQDAGILSPQFDPYPVDISTDGVVAKPALSMLPEISLDRLGDRRELARRLNQRFDRLLDQAELDQYDTFERQALNILSAPAMQQAFDLDRESEAMHEKYGRHRQGQSLLMARRLVEAGARFVSVYWGPDEQDWADGQGLRVAGNPWDTHRNHFPIVRDSLYPRLDQSLSALVQDLDQRGLLDETLLVWLGDFGRTPRISSPWASRDHWPAAFTILLAGGGIKPSFIYGRTDRHAAEVTEHPVSPADLTATLLSALGVPPSTHIRDQKGRSHRLSAGRVVSEIFA